MASLPKPTPEMLAANHGPGIIAGNLTVAILATVAVALRLCARYVQKTKLGVDDFLILAALVRYASKLSRYLTRHIETYICDIAVRLGIMYLYLDRYGKASLTF